jgi:hypothetical protein
MSNFIKIREGGCPHDFDAYREWLFKNTHDVVPNMTAQLQELRIKTQSKH